MWNKMNILLLIIHRSCSSEHLNVLAWWNLSQFCEITWCGTWLLNRIQQKFTTSILLRLCRGSPCPWPPTPSCLRAHGAWQLWVNEHEWEYKAWKHCKNLHYMKDMCRRHNAQAAITLFKKLVGLQVSIHGGCDTYQNIWSVRSTTSGTNCYFSRICWSSVC